MALDEHFQFEVVGSYDSFKVGEVSFSGYLGFHKDKNFSGVISMDSVSEFPNYVSLEGIVKELGVDRETIDLVGGIISSEPGGYGEKKGNLETFRFHLSKKRDTKVDLLDDLVGQYRGQIVFARDIGEDYLTGFNLISGGFSCSMEMNVYEIEDI